MYFGSREDEMRRDISDINASKLGNQAFCYIFSCKKKVPRLILQHRGSSFITILQSKALKIGGVVGKNESSYERYNIMFKRKPHVAEL